MIKPVIRGALKFLINIVYKSYKAEGINALLLLMPAKLITPVLRKHGAKIGQFVEIHSPLIIHNASSEPGQHYSNLTIGEHCYLGRDVFFDLKAPITLAPYVTISMRCTLITHTDVGQRPTGLRTLPPSRGPIIIESGAYLGAGVTVLEGVTIGERAVIAAGAVVTSDVPANHVVGGIPARTLRTELKNDEL